MLSKGGEENSIYHAFAAPFKPAGTARATSSIIKSGQRDTEASILENGKHCSRNLLLVLIFPQMSVG